MTLSLSGEDPRGPRRGAKGCCGSGRWNPRVPGTPLGPWQPHFLPPASSTPNLIPGSASPFSALSLRHVYSSFATGMGLCAVHVLGAEWLLAGPSGGCVSQEW